MNKYPKPDDPVIDFLLRLPQPHWTFMQVMKLVKKRCEELQIKLPLTRQVAEWSQELELST